MPQADYPPVVVSPLWVEESIKAGRRLVERKYLVGGWAGGRGGLVGKLAEACSAWVCGSATGCADPCRADIPTAGPPRPRQVKKPTESLLGRTPGSGAAGGAAAKKRKRPAAAVLPKPAEAYELDDLVFSSTQQMTGDAAGTGGEISSPRGGGGGKRRGGAGGRGGGARGGARQQPAAAAAMPSVAEEEEAEEEQQAAEAPAPSGIGTDTQAVRACSCDGLHGLLSMHCLPFSQVAALRTSSALPGCALLLSPPPQAGGQHPHHRPSGRRPRAHARPPSRGR